MHIQKMYHSPVASFPGRQKSVLSSDKPGLQVCMEDLVMGIRAIKMRYVC